MSRRLVAAAVAAFALVAPTASPAHASPGVVVLYGGLTFPAGRCDWYSTVSGTFWVEGSYRGAAIASGLSCSQSGIFCLLADTMELDVTGAVNMHLSMTRIGTGYFVNSSGDINGSGEYVMAFPEIGTSCNGDVTVTVAITLAGI